MTAASTWPGVIRLWDDNPSKIDLLGFDAVVRPILDAISTPDLDPLTIGVQSPWGGGKSTILNLISTSLSDDNTFLVIRTDPWQYDNHDDVRGTLIAEILDEIRTRFDSEGDVTDRVTELLKRISWSRVGLAVGKGVLSMGWNTSELIEAFTPKKRSEPESMSGFKDAFASLLKILPNIKRVVILVDDLDRCLPDAVMATLEAIKLFLAVDKIVFVLAADQDMVRDAIAASLSATRRNDRFAMQYLEKIVQLPVSLPHLAPHDAEAYIGLLLARSAAPSSDAFEELVEHCSIRRSANEFPLLGNLSSVTYKPTEDILRLAAQLSDGLSADRRANPRQIKRFLNAYGVRSSVATARKVEIDASVLMKMLLLEQLHRTSFETLAAADPGARITLLEEWVAWGKGKRDEPPNGVNKETLDWISTGPVLNSVTLTSYLTLAASLLNIRTGGALSDEVAGLLQDLLDEGDAPRSAAVAKLVMLGEAEQFEALDLTFSSSRSLDDASNLFTATIDWAVANPAMVPRVVTGIRENWSRLTTGAVVELANSGVDALIALCPEIAADNTLDSMVRQAAQGELGT
jgi:KAP family P-loop domain